RLVLECHAGLGDVDQRLGRTALRDEQVREPHPDVVPTRGDGQVVVAPLDAELGAAVDRALRREEVEQERQREEPGAQVQPTGLLLRLLPTPGGLVARLLPTPGGLVARLLLLPSPAGGLT